MLAFTIRRLFEAAIVMLTVALLAFVLFRFVGDPINQMVGQDTSIAEREELRERLGLNDPVLVQFGRFIWNAARYDFGISYQVKRPVTSLIAERFPASCSAFPWVCIRASTEIAGSRSSSYPCPSSASRSRPS